MDIGVWMKPEALEKVLARGRRTGTCDAAWRRPDRTVVLSVDRFGGRRHYPIFRLRAP